MFGKRTKKSEKILILGLGGVGYYLAKRLVHEGYAVTVIEADGQLVRHADGEMDARLIQGNAMSIACWKEAEADQMDCLIAVTDNDAVNMLAAMIADRFGIERKIARVRSREFDSPNAVLSAKDLKIDLVIHPEELTAQEDCPADQTQGRQRHHRHRPGPDPAHGDPYPRIIPAGVSKAQGNISNSP